MTKPKTQVAGVQGFSAFEAKPDAAPERIDWSRLVSLPPFEMFVVEQSGNPAGNLKAWVTDWVRKQGGVEAVYQQYCQWHREKGYWPNETPMGTIIDKH